MITSASFPNLSSPIFDRVRIPTRKTPADVANHFLAPHGVDGADLRGDKLRHKMSDLRVMCARAMAEEGVKPAAIAIYFAVKVTAARAWVREE